MEIKGGDLQLRALQKAMSIAEFCERYGVGRTLAYSEISDGRLRARKCRRRTLIAEADAQYWLQQLPMMSAPTSAA